MPCPPTLRREEEERVQERDPRRQRQREKLEAMKTYYCYCPQRRPTPLHTHTLSLSLCVCVGGVLGFRLSAAAVASFLAAILTEICLCAVCSCQERLRHVELITARAMSSG
jgi:hypothetical protein